MEQTRTERNKIIRPNKWYIVYEKLLTDPRVLQYHFEEEAFAAQFLRDTATTNRYSVYKGEDLIDMDIEKCNGMFTHKEFRPLNVPKDIGKFFFKETPYKRKHTLRVVYNRRKRRYMWNKVIADYPEAGKFLGKKEFLLKKILKTYFNKLVYTELLPDMKKWAGKTVYRQFRDADITPAQLRLYISVAKAIHTINKLTYNPIPKELYFQMGYLFYKNKAKVWDPYRYANYVMKFKDQRQVSPEQASAELLARGFLPVAEIDKPLDYPIQSVNISKKLIYPLKTIRNSHEAWHYFNHYGLEGYTRNMQPSDKY